MSEKCANFDHDDEVCVMCHMGRVERQQSCYKASETHEKMGLDLALKCIKDEDRQHCTLVRAVVRAVCENCKERSCENEGKV